MRKITLKIRNGTKEMILGLGILGVLGLSAFVHDAKKVAKTTFAVVGLVATMKTKGVWDNATPETKAFAEAQDEAMKSFTTLDALEAKLNSFAEEKGLKNTLTSEEKAEFKEMVEAVKSNALALKKIQDRGLSNEAGENPIMAALKENSNLDNFRTKKVKSLDLEIKGAATQDMPGDIATHTIGYRVPGVGQLPVRKPFLLDLFTTIPVNLEFIKYMDQETVVRDAKNVAGITASTSTTKLTWKERNIQITKVRDFIYVNQDMLSDYDFVMGEVQRLINTSVILKADSGLLLDDGTYPNLHSVDEVSSEFDAANTVGVFTGTVQEPNVFDLCVAMAAQIVALGQDGSYMPDTVLWNTIDKYKSMLVKDKNNNYLLPPFVVSINNKEYAIDGMKVRTNPNVPANTMYMFDSSKGTIYMRKGLGLEMAYNNNDDFEREIVTMKAYLRMNFLVRNVDRNAFMKCSDVETALVAIAKEPQA